MSVANAKLIASRTAAFPTTRNTPKTKPSASGLEVVSFFSLATDVLETVPRAWTVVLRACLLRTIDQLKHVRVQLIHIDTRLSAFRVAHVVGADHLLSRLFGLLPVIVPTLHLLGGVDLIRFQYGQQLKEVCAMNRKLYGDDKIFCVRCVVLTS